MAPKKKTNKKADEDWEPAAAEVPVVPADENVAESTATEANPEDEFPSGGLMAMMRKKQKKGKKGAPTEQGVDDDAEDAEASLAGKAPVEASLEDEFALPEKKNKSKSAVQSKEEDIDEDEQGADGKMLTKAQKEKLKKEREKQRKKENVSRPLWNEYMFKTNQSGCQEKDHGASERRFNSGESDFCAYSGGRRDGSNCSSGGRKREESAGSISQASSATRKVEEGSRGESQTGSGREGTHSRGGA